VKKLILLTEYTGVTDENNWSFFQKGKNKLKDVVTNGIRKVNVIYNERFEEVASVVTIKRNKDGFIADTQIEKLISLLKNEQGEGICLGPLLAAEIQPALQSFKIYTGCRLSLVLQLLRLCASHPELLEENIAVYFKDAIAFDVLDYLSAHFSYLGLFSRNQAALNSAERWLLENKGLCVYCTKTFQYLSDYKVLFDVGAQEKRPYRFCKEFIIDWNCPPNDLGDLFPQDLQPQLPTSWNFRSPALLEGLILNGIQESNSVYKEIEDWVIQHQVNDSKFT